MVHYFINRGNQKLGPFTLEEIKQQQLLETDMVWTPSNTDWRPIKEFTELQEAIIKAPPPTLKEKSKNEFINALKNNAFYPLIFIFLFGFWAFLVANSYLSKEFYDYYNEKKYWDQYENNLVGMITRPFRIVFSSSSDHSFYVIKEEYLFAKIMFFTYFDFTILYVIAIYLYYKLKNWY